MILSSLATMVSVSVRQKNIPLQTDTLTPGMRITTLSFSSAEDCQIFILQVSGVYCDSSYLSFTSIWMRLRPNSRSFIVSLLRRYAFLDQMTAVEMHLDKVGRLTAVA